MLRPAFEGVPRGDGALDRVAKELLADRVLILSASFEESAGDS